MPFFLIVPENSEVILFLIISNNQGTSQEFPQTFAFLPLYNSYRYKYLILILSPIAKRYE